MLAVAVIPPAHADKFDAMAMRQSVQELAQQGDRGASRRSVDWLNLMASLQSASLATRLEEVNDFFNCFRYTEDQVLWRRQDYWATPLETLRTGRGDCEDLTIAKYFTLRYLGVADSRLRLVHVKLRTASQAHMVLAVQSGGSWLVLDNLRTTVQTLGERSDLEPVYGFNGNFLWIIKSAGEHVQVGDASRLGQWQDLHRRFLPATLISLTP